MAKIRISSADLAWIFTEQLRERFLPNRIAPVAIVPTKRGWTAVTNRRTRIEQPLQANRIAQFQKRLSKVYVLAKE
jgi:hypothetical protein